MLQYDACPTADGNNNPGLRTGVSVCVEVRTQSPYCAPCVFGSDESYIATFCRLLPFGHGAFCSRALSSATADCIELTHAMPEVPTQESGLKLMHRTALGASLNMPVTGMTYTKTSARDTETRKHMYWMSPKLFITNLTPEP